MLVNTARFCQAVRGAPGRSVERAVRSAKACCQQQGTFDHSSHVKVLNAQGLTSDNTIGLSPLQPGGDFRKSSQKRAGSPTPA